MTDAPTSGSDLATARGHHATRSPVYSCHGMVAASQPLAAQAGLAILRQGGTAVDAAIATNACLGVMEPTSCGIGGDLFAIVYDPSSDKPSQLQGLNACGACPMALSVPTVRNAIGVSDGDAAIIPLHSPFAWTVPGCVDGWVALRKQYGSPKLTMADILAPAIQYARDGFPVSPVIAHEWRRGAEKFHDTPGFAEVFTPVPDAGSVFRNPALARTLESIAGAGDSRDGFYKGAVAHQLVEYSKRVGGFFSEADFAADNAEFVDCAMSTYRGTEVYELGFPGQGITALQILNILENFDLKELKEKHGAARLVHVMVEAKKLAYIDRARYFGDARSNPDPRASGQDGAYREKMQELQRHLLSKEYAKKLAAMIDDTAHGRAATEEPVLPDPVALAQRETTYLCAADNKSGLIISLIQSNYTGFGSGYCVPSLGFGLQNRGGCFNLVPGSNNVLAPGRRPFHTIIPAMMRRRRRTAPNSEEDDKQSSDNVVTAFGLMGGDMQPQGHAQVVVNAVDFSMNLQAAGDAPRFHHTRSSDPCGTCMCAGGGVLHLEAGFGSEVASDLARRMGHCVEETTASTFGGFQAISFDQATGVFCGASESRKDGQVVGW